MKINIYYGGRGLIEDPTIYVMNKITEVLQEIRVEVRRYNLYEEKNGLSMLPKTLKDADGIILAASVEWMGIGGYMQQFLDACWLYGDKDKISSLYMFPVVMSTSYGERDAELTLIKAWELLGGIPCNGLCAYVEDHVEFETNHDYMKIIEKKAENIYRIINQKFINLPTSNTQVKRNILRNNTIELTPQESEQLSEYVSDDTYVKKQKEDIEELAQMFKKMLGENDDTHNKEFLSNLRENFKPLENFTATYAIELTDINQTLIIEVKQEKMNCYYGKINDPDVMAKTSRETMESIVNGRMTFQKAFMTGDLTAKGNFKTLRTFDTIFQFNII